MKDGSEDPQTLGAAGPDPQVPAAEPPALENLPEAKVPPAGTGITEITYPCGCQAASPAGDLPPYCPDHPEQSQAAAPISNRHGQVFDAGVHAADEHGQPKADSAGRFILKEHDYNPPKSFPGFPG